MPCDIVESARRYDMKRDRNYAAGCLLLLAFLIAMGAML